MNYLVKLPNTYSYIVSILFYEQFTSMKEQNRTLNIQNFNTSEELFKSVTKEGSLGLLALGWQGLFLWRKKRLELGELFPPVGNTPKKDDAAESGQEKNI
jgi:hypothetical protein